MNWFEQNVDRIVGVYGKQYGVAAEDIVLSMCSLQTGVHDAHDH